MKILGYNYTVEYCDELTGSDCDGRTSARALKIQIARGMGPQQCESAMLHEIIEALNAALGVKLAHRSIDALEAGLYQTLTDAGVELGPLLKELRE